MKSVGVIGFGSFGAFLAQKLDPHTQVFVYSRDTAAGKWTTDFDTVAKADFLVLAVPLGAYQEVLTDLQGTLGAATVLVDVCSVKEAPVRMIRAAFPTQPLIACHPLFGPESAKDTVEGHTLVLCPEASDAAALEVVRQFAHKLGIRVQEMSATEHDQEMATVHALTFFVAHALRELHLHKQSLSTPSFKKLLSLAELETHHSDELFITIQAGNNHSNAVREQFIRLCKELDVTIDKARLIQKNVIWPKDS